MYFGDFSTGNKMVIVNFLKEYKFPDELITIVINDFKDVPDLKNDEKLLLKIIRYVGVNCN